MPKQSSDKQVGGGGNMTFKTKSKSPTHGQGDAWRDDSNESTDDNNGFRGRLEGRVARERSVG